MERGVWVPKIKLKSDLTGLLAELQGNYLSVSGSLPSISIIPQFRHFIGYKVFRLEDEDQAPLVVFTPNLMAIGKFHLFVFSLSFLSLSAILVLFAFGLEKVFSLGDFMVFSCVVGAVGCLGMNSSNFEGVESHANWGGLSRAFLAMLAMRKLNAGPTSFLVAVASICSFIALGAV